jgi:hypothetical protein
MTLDRVIEVAAMTALAAGTTAMTLVEANVNGFVVPLVSGGVAALVGYFSAQITVRAELAMLKTEIRMLREELYRYYSIRRRHDDDADHGA